MLNACMISLRIGRRDGEIPITYISNVFPDYPDVMSKPVSS